MYGFIALTESKSSSAVKSPPAKAMYGFIALTESKSSSAVKSPPAKAMYGFIALTESKSSSAVKSPPAKAMYGFIALTESKSSSAVKSPPAKAMYGFIALTESKSSSAVKSPPSTAIYAGIASKAANLLRSTAKFTSAKETFFASCSAASPIAGSVAAVARHAAQAIAVADVEIFFAHTVITSLGCGASTASRVVPCADVSIRPLGETYLKKP